MKTVELDNNEKVFILDLKGKFKDVDNSMNKILGEAYALYPEQVAKVTLISFVRDLYTKLVERGIICDEKDRTKYLVERLTLLNSDPIETMISDIKWLTKENLETLEVYDCDYSFLY